MHQSDFKTHAGYLICPALSLVQLGIKNPSAAQSFSGHLSNIPATTASDLPSPHHSLPAAAFYLRRPKGKNTTEVSVSRKLHHSRASCRSSPPPSDSSCLSVIHVPAQPRTAAVHGLDHSGEFSLPPSFLGC